MRMPLADHYFELLLSLLIIKKDDEHREPLSTLLLVGGRQSQPVRHAPSWLVTGVTRRGTGTHTPTEPRGSRRPTPQDIQRSRRGRTVGTIAYITVTIICTCRM